MKLPAFVLLCVSVCLSGFAASAAPRPNVVFIISDDLRPELGCYGAAHMKTPHLDRLAGEGLLFRRAYVQQAVCAASRASFLTGVRPDTTGVDYPYTKWFVDEFLKSRPSLMRSFLENGYHVRTLGKVHHGYDEPLSEPHFKPRAGFYADPGTIAATRGRSQKDAPVLEFVERPDSDYMDGQIAEAAVETLGRVAKGDKPFFLAVGFQKPHLPFVAPKRYADLYDPMTLPSSPNPKLAANVPELATAHHAITKYAGIASDDVADEVARELRRGYFACVSFMDAQVGRVLAELDRLGLRESTVVVFIGDHGWHLGDHQMWGKSTNFERSTHTPLIVRWPGARSSVHRTDALVEFVDIYPTLLDVCGLKIPDYLEGTSFKALLEEPARPWKSAVFSQFHRGKTREGYAARDARWRYVEWRDFTSSEQGQIIGRELYDHEEDPHEAINLVDDPQHQAVLDKMSGRLRAGWKSSLPPGVVNHARNPRAPPSEKLRDSSGGN